jgi:hypothetical protein
VDDPLAQYINNIEGLNLLENSAKESKVGSLIYLGKCENIFYHDITVCFKYIHKMADPASVEMRDEERLFWYRTATRSFISYVDGVIGAMKDIIRWAHHRGEISLDDFDLVAINENRRVNLKKRKVYNSNRSFEEHLDIVLHYLPKIFGSNFKVDKTGDYRYFKNCLKYRHSITHPNKPLDIIIPSQDVGYISKAPVWFHTTMSKLFQSCKDNLP